MCVCVQISSTSATVRMCASTFLLGTCVRTFKSVCVCVWSRPPIISCQLKGVPATLPSPPTFPLPRGGPADDTGESTAGAASRCALRHPSLKQPAARTSGPPPLLLPSCNPSSPSGVREGFFFDGLVTVLWLIALRPKLAAGGPRQRLNKEGQKGRRRGEELKGYKRE